VCVFRRLDSKKGTIPRTTMGTVHDDVIVSGRFQIKLSLVTLAEY